MIELSGSLRLASASVRFTSRIDGDLGDDRFTNPVDASLDARRRAVVDRPWTWLRQVHGANVVGVRFPGDAAGAPADAAVTDQPDCVLAVLTADCAPVALASEEGVVGVAHAGWAGLEAGVVQRTVEKMRGMGATDVRALIGPCIEPQCYEFGPADLDRLASTLGESVRARTAAGAPALSLAAGVVAALSSVGVVDVDDVGVCTACSGEHFSWRKQKDRQRQAAVVWR